MSVIAAHSPSVTSSYRTYQNSNSTAVSSNAVQPEITTAALSTQTGAVASHTGNGITNSQGHAARMALGSTVNLEGHGVGTYGGSGAACQTPASGRLDASYDKSLKTNGSEKLNAESKNTRLVDLDKVSQLDSNGDTIADESRCAASTVVAGMYYSQGAEGIQSLVKDMQAYNKKHDLQQPTNFGSKEFQARLKSGKLTKDDLNQVQEQLHWTLTARQDAVQEANGQAIGLNDGIGSNILKDFVKSSPSTKKAFDDNGLTIAMVDTDKDGGGNHFVLAGKHEGSSFVYDPYSNKGPDNSLHQVTLDPDRLRQYRDAITAQDNNQKYVYSSEPVAYSTN